MAVSTKRACYGNEVVGIATGYPVSNKGGEAAMRSHFSADIVLDVLKAL